MIPDKLNLKLKGVVSIFKEGVPIFSKQNEITSDALKIIMMCLAGIPNKPFIDIIKAYGSFDNEVDLEIFDSFYDEVEKSITFIANAFEGSFDGTVDTLKLHCSLLGLNLSVKEGLSILKGSDERLQIHWKILITNC